MTFKEFLGKEYAPWYIATFPKTGEEGIKDLRRNFEEDFGSLILSEVTRAHIEKWRIKRAQMNRTRIIKGRSVRVPIGPATVNRNVEKLSAVFNKAVEFVRGIKNKICILEARSTRALRDLFMGKDA
jgi:hypothetical protein